ncbi:hypothetical protein [Peptoniphilus asaccharolyticus]
MKKLGTLLLTGIVLGGTMMTNMMPVNASEMKMETKKANKCAYILDIEKQEESFIDYIKKSKNITEVEKEQLIKTEKELEPTWKKIEDLETKSNDINEKIMGDIYERYDELFNANEKIWEKFYEEMKEEDLTDDIMSDIEKSKTLTAEEKAILKADEQKLKELDKEMEKLADKADEETKEINSELDKLYKIVEQETEKNQKIYDKLFPEMTPLQEKISK